MSGANDRTSVGGGSMEYGTPVPFYIQMNRRWQFNYDAFASHENAKCDVYSTLNGTFRRYARRVDAPIGSGEVATMPLDDLTGLELPWLARRVFCNPPYSRGLILPCVKKMAAEALLPSDRSPEIIVALLPAATDTDWFQDWVMPHANITYLRKRISFIHPPFECGPTCQTGTTPHPLGKPLKNPPGAYCIAEYRTKWVI